MRTKSETRRRAIVDTAQAMFEKVGYDQLSMSSIAAELGGSKATLYTYFSSKEELFAEITRLAARQHVDQLLALLKPTGDIANSLRIFGEQMLKHFHSRKKTAALRTLIAASSSSNAGRVYYAKGPAAGMKRLAAHLEAMMQTGQLRRADPHVVAAHLRALVESEVQLTGLLNARAELRPAQIKTVVARAIDAFLRAYGPDQGRASQPPKRGKK